MKARTDHQKASWRLQAGVFICSSNAVTAPANNLRIGATPPCAHTGFCQDPYCHPPNRICCQLVITEASMVPGRLLVVLVGEALGY